MRNLRNNFAAVVIAMLAAPLSFAENLDSAASATNALGLDLYRQLANGEGNLCISPYSISCALAMTLSGADGETREEMSRVLHLEVKAENDRAFSDLQKALDESAAKTVTRAKDSKKFGGPSEPVTFSLANRLFPQKGYDVRPEFLARVQEFYGAPLEPLDFRGDATGATQHINDWVAKQTRDRIRDLIPRPLDVATRLVLANALYFKAPWANEFSEDSTGPEPFRVGGKESADVPTMRAEKSFGYAQEKNFIAVALPYSGDEFQLLVLLPNESSDLAALDKIITAETLAQLAKIPRTALDLHFPKFKFEPPTMPLAKKLQALGMKSAFDDPPRSANFDRMAERKPNEYLAISEVFHKTFIAVDEKGTEAAAATAVAMIARTTAIQRSDPIEVRVDRPFIYAIQHAPSGACLFIGRVTDPR